MKKIVCTLLAAVLFMANLALAAVNINTADVKELATLPGIGPAKAENIIRYREEHGPFQNIHDLAKVKGIGKKTLEKIGQEITVE